MVILSSLGQLNDLPTLGFNIARFVSFRFAGNACYRRPHEPGGRLSALEG